MLVSRAFVVLLVAVAVAACVRNPMPAAPAVVPGPPARAVVGGASGEAASPRWEWRHADLRTVGGAERAAASLPREWRGLRVAEPVRCAAFEPADYLAGGLPFPRLRAEPDGFREPLGCSLFSGAGDPAVHAGGVVSAEAAHDAGLCARPEARAAFAADPDNRLFLPVIVAAARHRTLTRGDGEWLPSRNLF